MANKVEWGGERECLSGERRTANQEEPLRML